TSATTVAVIQPKAISVPCCRGSRRAEVSGAGTGIPRIAAVLTQRVCHLQTMVTIGDELACLAADDAILTRPVVPGEAAAKAHSDVLLRPAIARLVDEILPAGAVIASLLRPTTVLPDHSLMLDLDRLHEEV